MKGKPVWKKFFSEKDKIYYNQGEVRGDQFIFRSATHPGNILATVDIQLPNFKEPETRKGLVALYTSSAGAITAGMGVNERPDLYSSFIAEVPRLNPYGLEVSSTASSTSYLEYGSVKDSIEFRGLLQMDPFLNIRQGVSYPAVLVMPSNVDDRIPLWDSGKYIAKIQELNLSCNPLYLDINYSSGHTGSAITEDISATYSKIFSFARSNMVRKEQLLKF